MSKFSEHFTTHYQFSFCRACQAIAVRASSAAAKESENPIQKAHDLFNSPDRDYVNFPNPVQAVDPPAVRLGFIPDSWFQAFYNKTGVTGQ